VITAEAVLLEDPLLGNYPPSERRAILVHRYFLGIEWGYDPGTEAAVASWEAHVASIWRRTKLRRDTQEQLRHIARHQAFLSEAQGRAIDWNEAAADWARKHAAAWRESWEQTPEAGA
jgi:hypothetical protein